MGSKMGVTITQKNVPASPETRVKTSPGTEMEKAKGVVRVLIRSIRKTMILKRSETIVGLLGGKYKDGTLAFNTTTQILIDNVRDLNQKALMMNVSEC